MRVYHIKAYYIRAYRIDYHIKAENKNVLNPSKQSLKRIFVFKYSETCLSIQRNTKQITTKTQT